MFLRKFGGQLELVHARNLIWNYGGVAQVLFWIQTNLKLNHFVGRSAIRAARYTQIQ